MKRFKLASITLAFLLSTTVFAGCANTAVETDKTSSGSAAGEMDEPSSGSTSEVPKKANGKAMEIASVDAKELQATTDADEAASSVASGANDFAFRLSAALAPKYENKNFVCSPFSVWIPLAALTSATDDQNKDALLAALGAHGFSENDVNNTASRMLYDLTMERNKNSPWEYNPLQIANAVFVSDQMTLKKEFAQDFMDYYRGAAMNVDFTSPKAVDAINRWASENTEGLITDIVQEFDPNTVAALANAIYFSDRWRWEFNSGLTKEDVFYSPSGETTASFMTLEREELPYYEDDKVQAISLPFQTTGGMYIILPKDGDAAGLLSSMTSEYFDEINEGIGRRSGKLLLPRFSADSGVIPLKDTLEALGVPLFDRQSAPLTGGLLEEDVPVWLSEALHKALIEVDEQGATATAVTVMVANTLGIPQPTEPFEMNCNKPFIFVLDGYTKDGRWQILFTGMINRP